MMLRLFAKFYFWVSGWKIEKKPPPDLKKCVLLAAPHTSNFDFVYGRLIGDRKKVEEKTKTFDRLVLDKSADLDRWARLLEGLLAEVPKAYVFANNHYAGHGPATIRALAGKVGE